MKVRFAPNKRPIDVINPYVTYQEIKELQRGNITITPNTVASHLFSTSIGGYGAYKFLGFLTTRGVPIGPVVPFKTIKSAHFLRSITSPIRYAPYYASPDRDWET